MTTMLELAGVVLPALLGLWVLQVQLRRSRPLAPGDTATGTAGIFLVVMVLMLVGQAVIANALWGETLLDADPDRIFELIGLEPLLALQAATNLGAVMVLLLMTRAVTGDPTRALGLRSLPGPRTWLLALGCWLAFRPVLLAVSLINEAMLEQIGVEDGTQDILAAFIGDASARESLVVWGAAGFVIPVCEEILFRGALYGALRRWVGVPVAMALSAIVFGLAHDAAAQLPVAALGVAMAWLYERTGSLAAPIALHVLHNTAQLAIVTFVPEAAA